MFTYIQTKFLNVVSLTICYKHAQRTKTHGDIIGRSATGHWCLGIPVVLRPCDVFVQHCRWIAVSSTCSNVSSILSFKCESQTAWFLRYDQLWAALSSTKNGVHCQSLAWNITLVIVAPGHSPNRIHQNEGYWNLIIWFHLIHNLSFDQRVSIHIPWCLSKRGNLSLDPPM